MNSKLKQHLFIILAYVMAIVASFILGNLLLLPICNSIMGSEKEGVALTQTIMRLLWPAIAFIIIFFYKKNGSEEKITFVAKLREEPYDFKNDFNKIMKSKDFWAELIFVAVITFVYWIFNYVFGWIFINIPLYFVFNLCVSLCLHKSWAKNAHIHYD